MGVESGFLIKCLLPPSSGRRPAGHRPAGHRCVFLLLLLHVIFQPRLVSSQVPRLIRIGNGNESDGLPFC